jgi:23S rRNA (cytidine1920-2'-O)/16S rRNA (cytidine1409-2'-O)-methyltransferase
VARSRLDELIVARGLASTRQQAGVLLLAGQVRVGSGDGARRDRKPGEMVRSDVELSLVQPPPYVSRGGEKLVAGLDAFAIDPAGRVCLDVGASTGGFTDVLLQRGAARVYALDVGRGQLAESLRGDARVVSLERTHAARLEPGHPQHVSLPEAIELAVIDVSFIALSGVLPGVSAVLGPDADVIALVKPQFEAEPRQAPGGVVRDDAVRRSLLDKAIGEAEALGFVAGPSIDSPLPGPAGNREFLLQLRWHG